MTELKPMSPSILADPARRLLDAWGIDPEEEDPIGAIALVGELLLEQLRAYASACLALPSERLRELPGGASRARAMSRGTWMIVAADDEAQWGDEADRG